MIDHDDDGPLHALQREGPDAKHHETEMTHRRVGYELLEVRLHHCHQGAVDDPNHRERDDDRHDRGVERDFREERQGESQKPIGTHLQENPSQDHRGRRGRLNMGVRQPRVEREHRDLDREREGKRREQPKGPRAHVLGILYQMRVAERVNTRLASHDVVHHQDGDEHEQRAEEGVNEELDGGIHPARTTPCPDEEIHRDEHDFPEHIEQEHVERDKHAEHACGEQQQ